MKPVDEDIIKKEFLRNPVSCIKGNHYAADAARILLADAMVYLDSNQPLPPALSNVISDALEHFFNHDPVAAFPNLLQRPKPKRGAPSKESETEKMDEVLSIYWIAKQLGQGRSEKDPDKDAFIVRARQKTGSTDDAVIRREAARLRKLFERFKQRCPPDAQEMLESVMPRRNKKKPANPATK